MMLTTGAFIRRSYGEWRALQQLFVSGFYAIGVNDGWHFYLRPDEILVALKSNDHTRAGLVTFFDMSAIELEDMVRRATPRRDHWWRTAAGLMLAASAEGGIVSPNNLGFCFHLPGRGEGRWIYSPQAGASSPVRLIRTIGGGKHGR